MRQLEEEQREEEEEEEEEEEKKKVSVSTADATAAAAARSLGTTFRLYRVTLEQFNDVLAQENGMKPGDPACCEITAEEAIAMARAWDGGVWDENTAVHSCASSSNAVSTNNANNNTGPPAEMRAPSERWYGYVKCVGSMEGEAVLTFTCAPGELRGFREGRLSTNQPSEAYVGTIKRGLIQTGMTEDVATEYLRARCDAPMCTDSRVRAPSCVE